MSLRILFIGIAGDRLSEAALGACLDSGAFVDSVASVKSIPMRRDAGTPALRLAGRAARPWRGDADELLSEIQTKKVNTIITAGCHNLLPGRVLESARHGCFNVHPSLLPKYRGYAPIFWQYHEGDRQAGVTVHRMDQGVDTGPVVGQESFEISMGSALAEVVPRYSSAAARLVASLLSQISRGRVEEQPQDERAPGPAAPKPREADYRIDWQAWPLERIGIFFA